MQGESVNGEGQLMQSPVDKFKVIFKVALIWFLDEDKK